MPGRISRMGSGPWQKSDHCGFAALGGAESAASGAATRLPRRAAKHRSSRSPHRTAPGPLQQPAHAAISSRHASPSFAARKPRVQWHQPLVRSTTSSPMSSPLLLPSALQILLHGDRFIHSLYGIHLNGFVWNLLTTLGGPDSLGGGEETAASFALIITGLAVGQCFLLVLASRLPLLKRSLAPGAEPSGGSAGGVGFRGGGAFVFDSFSCRQFVLHRSRTGRGRRSARLRLPRRQCRSQL